MIELTFDIDEGDTAKLNRLITGLERTFAGHAITTGGTRDIRTWLGMDVLPYLQNRARDRFYAQGDDASGKWARLTPATRSWRRYFIKRDGLKIKPAEPINKRTGELQRFVTTTYDINSSAAGATLLLPSRRTGSRHMAAKLRHAQRGGMSNVGRSFPARPVASIGIRDKTVIDRLLVNWAEDTLRALQ